MGYKGLEDLAGILPLLPSGGGGVCGSRCRGPMELSKLIPHAVERDLTWWA